MRRYMDLVGDFSTLRESVEELDNALDAALAEVARLKAELEKAERERDHWLQAWNNKQLVVSRETVERCGEAFSFADGGVNYKQAYRDMPADSFPRKHIDDIIVAVLTAAGLRVEGEPAANLPAKPDSSPELSDEELAEKMHGSVWDHLDAETCAARWKMLPENVKGDYFAYIRAIRPAIEAPLTAEIERLRARVAELEGGD